jgi:hypothetical protein
VEDDAMRRLTVAVLMLALMGLIGAARADDKKDSPTGTWKWTINFGGQERELAVKLKADGEKLTGKFVSPDGKESDIEDGKYKDGELSFKVTRERDGNKFVIKFKGKVKGDTLKGKTEFERNGESQNRDWEAKRG